jgi:hypothetical protein
MGSLVSKVTDAVGLTDVKGTRQRAEQQAAAQQEAGMLAAQSNVFRPIGMTTRFGSSFFNMDTDPATGLPRVVSAGYETDPALVAMQDALFRLGQGSLGYAAQAGEETIPLAEAGRSLFDLGRQYLATSPEQARQQYIQEQTALLDPLRQREEDRLGSSVFARGRAGLNVGARGQPELATLAEARRMQDLQLAANAEQAAQQRIGFGSSLFGQGVQRFNEAYALPSQALAPLQSYLGTIGAIEEMGQQPFDLGLRVGGLVSDSSGRAGSLLANAAAQAAATQQRGGDAASAQLNNFMQKMLGSAIGGFGLSYGQQAPAPIYDRSIYR